MAETTEDTKPIAYRQLKRFNDGRMRVVYIDEDGNLIDYNDLGDYRVNEVVGSTTIPDASPEEEEEEEPETTPSTSTNNEPVRDEPTERGGSGEIVREDPYLGENQWRFMEDMQQRVGNFVQNSRIFKGAEYLADKAIPYIDRTEEFLKNEEIRRQDLREAAKPSIDASARVDYPGVDAAPVPRTVSQLARDLGKPVSTGMPMENLKAYEDDEALIEAILSGTPGPDGGLPIEITEQVARGRDLGKASAQTVVDNQLAEQREYIERTKSVDSDMTALQDVRMDTPVRTVEVINQADLIQETPQSYLSDRMTELGYTPSQIAGVAGNIAVESEWDAGAVPPASMNEDSFGLFQHNGPRKRELLQKENPAHYKTQIDFTLDELATTEKKADKALRAAKTPEAAALAFSKHFERPSIPNNNSRVNEALKFYSNPPATSTIGIPDYKPSATTYNPTSTTPSMYEGRMQGGNLSSDDKLGGYSVKQSIDPTPTQDRPLGFTSPIMDGPEARSVKTTSIPSSSVPGPTGFDLDSSGFSRGFASPTREGISVDYQSGDSRTARGRSNGVSVDNQSGASRTARGTSPAPDTRSVRTTTISGSPTVSSRESAATSGFGTSSGGEFGGSGFNGSKTEASSGGENRNESGSRSSSEEGSGQSGTSGGGGGTGVGMSSSESAESGGWGSDRGGEFGGGWF